jgi:hypothetical protein
MKSRVNRSFLATASGQEWLLKLAAQSVNVDHATVHMMFENLTVDPWAIAQRAVA